MAILKNKKSDIRSEIRSKIRKMDFEKMLNEEIIESNIPVLLNRSTAPLIQVQKYVSNEVRENNKLLNDTIERKINEIISDDMIESIQNFLRTKRNKENIENEIQNLKSKINLLNDEDDLIEKCKLEIELSKKEEEELREAKEIFIRDYKEGIENSILPSELYEMFAEVQCIGNEMREEIYKEIDSMRAKAKALSLTLAAYDIAYDMSLMLENRVNNEVGSERLIKSSKEQIPIVQVLMK